MSEHETRRRAFPMPEGRAAFRTLLRLAIASLIVGALLAIFNINPVELWMSIWHAIERGVTDIFGTGVQGVALVLTLIATGAVIVVPIWLLRTLLSSRRK